MWLGSTCLGCYDAIFSILLWEPTFTDPRLWLGKRASRGACEKGTL